MSAFDVEGLIKLVKKYVFIYDISNNKYKNATLKAAVWKSISEKLGMGSNCEAVRHKWKTIRDGYMKYKKQVQQSEGTGKKVMEYVWSSQLSFLDKYNVSRKSAMKYHLPQVPTSPPSSPPHSPFSDQELEEAEPPAKRKRSIEQGQIDHHILNIVNHQNAKKNDADYHLFMSYAETFKTFSPRQQANLKIALAKLFSNAELRELNKTSGYSSPKSSGNSPLYHNIKEEMDEENDYSN